MQKLRAAVLAALWVALGALLAGCETQQPSSAPAPAAQTEALPADAQSEEGLVLDASDGLLVLRTVYNVEYVFRMGDVDDRVAGGTAAGQYVRVWYSGQLEGTNARNVKLLRIETAQEQQADALALGSSAEGFVTGFSEITISIQTASGERYRFVAAENVRAFSSELHEGMWVRVFFDGTPEAPVVSRVTESAEAADVFTLVGTLRGVDEEKGTVSILADTGAWYTFALGDAEVDAPDGLWAGTRRYVLSYRGAASAESAEHALLLRLQAERLAGTQSLQGVVCAVDPAWGSIDLCTADGRVLRFAVGASILSGENGLQPGDAVRVEYTGCISGASTAGAKVTALELRAREGMGECSVLGSVHSVSEKLLVLDASDGRTLRFAAEGNVAFGDALQRGDVVRVAYRGWVAGDDTQNAALLSVSRAYD